MLFTGKENHVLTDRNSYSLSSSWSVIGDLALLGGAILVSLGGWLWWKAKPERLRKRNCYRDNHSYVEEIYTRSKKGWMDDDQRDPLELLGETIMAKTFDQIEVCRYKCGTFKLFPETEGLGRVGSPEELPASKQMDPGELAEMLIMEMHA